MNAGATPRVVRELHDDILVVTINNPPVNALGVDVRRGLLEALETAATLAQVRAVLLVGAGRDFLGGADIREFGQPPQAPALPDVCNRIEASTKPVIAAIHGAALGGGLEVALAAHYRVALPSAKLGLPEVLLGLLPGAGGTQRTPRLVGARAALDLMLSGRHIGAKEALTLGLVDRIAEGDEPQDAGLAYARELLAQGAPLRRTCEATALADRAAQQAAIDAARAETAKKARGLFSPAKIVDAVQAALDLPFDEGLARERELFVECLDSPQRAGLVHAFFAERATAKSPELRGARPRPIHSVGVIGGGTMGAGIAVALLDAGLPVTMIERDEAALARGRANVAKVYDGLVVKGRMTADARAAVLARWQGSTAYDALAEVDLVIEAVFEEMAVKQAVFAQLERVCKPGAVLATNTSYLDIDRIAAGTARPADVIGLHFFSPANLMKLLEIVVPAQVAPDVVATAFELARRLRKTPVRAGVCDGFIGNRILAVYRQAADRMMEDGASPYQIDRAIRAFGYPIGPYEMADLAGGDIGWATRKRKAATRDPAARYVQIADRLCERGWFGQKTGRGFYLYPEGARSGTPDPEVEAIIAAERQRAGIAPRAFSDDEIVRRYLAAMINEGANVVDQGIALRPLDVDVTLLHGYAFPRYRGGPMKYADTVGLPQVLADIRRYAEEDPVFWRPSPLLVRLVEEGADFDSLNKTGVAHA
ncbi:3-hydroxyacyl-CoA dehydrogenase NAD-binding domain-containing protein [Pseudoduganella chitinolytica]|uniref:3-hydroxyacyl-CoA dehydrogenase NAD-binding domain-containing protein n=1 Tax=Pseudoduganella chitinolytica TaxID=34070 RepID=A0ABY8BAD9_9BURK|nr:3-hydroxyacyl-CoA dehydrogenase NAD-binding domain-containing protein [Pseudoduganella chitinolytica]WEF32881.1 3-hydroxyacyl-CoA dehydrogenase NAD-binding domain-containing protein [Pseudoduganella chitinolytica]